MDELELEFELDPRLVTDTIALGDFPLCRLLLMNDSQYPWLILVPRRAGVTELYHLPASEQQQLIHEVSELSETLADLFLARKMNVGALGNMVPQLHVHVIVRKESDPAWPGPVWGRHPAVPYTDEELARVRGKLERLLDGELAFEPHD
ncbi:HIT domain-containing protein [Marinobacterium sediminicola]|uniref:Diadenosine tetraphosphate (Ap4A) hydrolase n=1 Tax=Marinobacterium sediminicola TaxID=518898 RepID=A0ABY1RX61_9GAMM|nr:HIT domain-containing protein [Marinobacterium sediminicola]ULG67905.1 HIT domain-containing protein [Marinobacterium sediminicola]SMR71388.1 Diadenosine tetraphosphate (Ap4A) hydrolase [Marinobacterium sediminicola]